MGAGGDALGPVIVPKTNKLHYGHIKLPNGLEVLLISDPEADKASAALDVNVGSMSDPEELPGLAHFLEHMLFYSSEKYPEEDAYSKFISEHGGSTNAFTAAEDTNFHFDVNYDHLEPALDRFAQFFLSPLISKDGVEREVNAVDSEHGKNINSDSWRYANLWKRSSNPQHAFSHFTTGNLETLITRPKARGLSAHQAVREFAEQRYSADIMKLVVYGRESVQELESLAQSKFAAVRSKGLRSSFFEGDAVLEEQLQTQIRVVPQKENDSIGMQWPIPPQQGLHRTQPGDYVSHLLGHEGEGSVFALLKARGWATQLYAGESGLSFSGRSFFEVGIVLTKEGQKHVKEVTGLVFAYISMLRKPEGVTKERFKEIQALAEMRFNFSDRIKPGSLTSMLARTLQHAPVEDVLLALHHVPQEFDGDAIRAVLADLDPSRIRIMWASKEFQGKTDLKDDIYGTEFSRGCIPQEWLDHWSAHEEEAGLHLPQQNPFIPTDFELLEDETTASGARAPEVVSENALLKLWHKQETSFGAPKAVVYAALQCPEAYSTPENAVLTRIFVKLVSDRLSEVSYNAELAGLSYNVLNTTSGLLLTFSGYNHKLMELVRVVVGALIGMEVNETRFEVQKEAVMQEYANMQYDQPYQTAMYYLNVLLELRRWNVEEYKIVIKGLTANDLTAWLARLFRRVWSEIFVTGNIDRAGATQIAEHIEGLLKAKAAAEPLFPSQRAEKRVIALPQGKPALLQMPTPNAENENSALALAYQSGTDDLTRNVLGELLVLSLKQEAFHQLRTQQQLGYIVVLTALSTLLVRSVAFILQSTNYAAETLEQRCEKFLEAAADIVRDLSDSDFESYRLELIKAKLEKPTRLREQAAKEWREIDDKTLIFQRPDKEVEALRKVTRQSLTDFFEETLLDVRQRRKVSVQVRGAAHAADARCKQQLANGSSDGPERPCKEGKEAVLNTEDSEGSATAEAIGSIWEYKRRQAVFPSSP